MSISTQFKELGEDNIKAVQIMKWLYVEPEEFQMSIRFERFKDIVKYMEKYDLSDVQFLINRACVAKDVDRLTHVWEYINLLQTRDQLNKQTEMLKPKLEIYGNSEVPEAIMARESALELSQKKTQVDEQIAIYEK